VGGDHSTVATLAVIGLVSDVNWLQCALKKIYVFRVEESEERGRQNIKFALGVCLVSHSTTVHKTVQ